LAFSDQDVRVVQQPVDGRGGDACASLSFTIVK
jgi:hypothetical protein